MARLYVFKTVFFPTRSSKMKCLETYIWLAWRIYLNKRAHLKLEWWFDNKWSSTENGICLNTYHEVVRIHAVAKRYYFWTETHFYDPHSKFWSNPQKKNVLVSSFLFIIIIILKLGKCNIYIFFYSWHLFGK